MKTSLYYYSGTGNSLWSARFLAKNLGNANVYPMVRFDGKAGTEADCIGMVFPVHVWGLPRRVIDFMNRVPADKSKYYFALAVNGGQVAATLKQLKKLLNSRGIPLSSGFDICMPSNYIPWGGPGSEKKQKERFSEAEHKIKNIADIVKRKETRPVEKGPLWQNVLFSGIYKLSFDKIPVMDSKFYADEKCNSCNICERICPALNIEMLNEKPRWRHHCEQCLACIQWCPMEAIQYGKRTVKFKRYHHPEVKSGDFIHRDDGKQK